MKKYVVTGVIGAIVISFSVGVGSALAAYIQSGTVVASIMSTTGKEEKVVKITDGTTTCYVVAEQFPAISCVK